MPETKRISSAALTVLWAASYPGDVRQLRNVVERAAMVSGCVIEKSDLLRFPGGRRSCACTSATSSSSATSLARGRARSRSAACWPAIRSGWSWPRRAPPSLPAALTPGDAGYFPALVAGVPARVLAVARRLSAIVPDSALLMWASLTTLSL